MLHLMKLSVAQAVRRRMMNQKERERKLPWTNLMYCLDTCVEGMGKTMKILSQDSRSSDRDLNSIPLEYEARLLITISRFSVLMSCT